VFENKRVTCLVNPRACHETELVIRPAAKKKRIAVVGAGPAGLACATVLADRGHTVDLFEAEEEIGGQLNMARRIPGKEEWGETLRYFRRRLAMTGVRVHLGQRVDADDLRGGGHDEVVLASGVVPRVPDIPGMDHETVLSYVDVLAYGKPVGDAVAVVGAGGIGFDVAGFLTGPRPAAGPDLDRFLAEWGVDRTLRSRGGLLEGRPAIEASPRRVILLQRKAEKHGKSLGRTTGWIHRMQLRRRGVEMVSGVSYGAIDDRGLHITVNGEARVLEVDHIVICAGQESRPDWSPDLQGVNRIGGVASVDGLDARRAIAGGWRLGMAL